LFVINIYFLKSIYIMFIYILIRMSYEDQFCNQIMTLRVWYYYTNLYIIMPISKNTIFNYDEAMSGSTIAKEKLRNIDKFLYINIV